MTGQCEKTINRVTNKEHCASRNQTGRRVVHTANNKTETLDDSQIIQENRTECHLSDLQLAQNAAESHSGLSAFDSEFRDKSIHECTEDSETVRKNPSVSSPVNLSRQDDGISCKICGRHFKGYSSLSLHLRAHRRYDSVQPGSKECSDSVQKFRCQKCSFVSAYAFCLARHMRNWHGAGKTSVSPGRSEASLQGRRCGVNEEQTKVQERGKECSERKRRYMCEDCGFTSADIYTLAKHSCELQGVTTSHAEVSSVHKRHSANDHQTRQTESSGTNDDAAQEQNVTISVQNSNPEDSHERNRSSSHMCELCGRKFNSSLNLAKHARVHDRIHCLRQSSRADGGNCMELTCSVCGFVANHQNSLFHHLRDKHIAFEVRNAEGCHTFH